MKPKTSNAPARESEVDGDSPQRPEMVRLDGVPIADPWHEKKMFEKGEFARKLNRDYAGTVIVQNEDVNRSRIIEANRQCFNSGYSTGSRLKVIRDFAAHFPDLMFDAFWIKELVRRESVEHSFSKAQREVFDAIQTGLRSAAKSQPRESATRKHFRISAAQLVAKETIGPEISKWNKSLQRDSAPLLEWIELQAAEKAKELMRTYGLQGRDARRRLTKFLDQGHCYEAAVLIASELLNVAERDIESKID